MFGDGPEIYLESKSNRADRPIKRESYLSNQKRELCKSNLLPTVANLRMGEK